MVKISYAYKKMFFGEKKKMLPISRIFISFRNRPTRITNIIINTVNIARLF